MSALSTLFQDIADAIREKTGSTDKIAPADFPIQIYGIETGGGSGEATGAFWKEEAMLPTSTQVSNAHPFIYKNELYAILIASTLANSTIYKYTGSEWIKHSDYGSNYTMSYQYNAIEHNGVMHFIGGDSDVHITWDGANWTQLDALPANCVGRHAISYNGELYYCSLNSKVDGSFVDAVWKYDDNAMTWNAYATYNPKYSFYGPIFQYNSKLYVGDNTLSSIYEITSGNIALSTDLDFSGIATKAGVQVFTYDNILLAISTTDGGVAKLENGEWTVFPNIPTYNIKDCPTILFNGKLFCMGFSYAHDKRRVFSLDVS